MLIDLQFYYLYKYLLNKQPPLELQAKLDQQQETAIQSKNKELDHTHPHLMLNLVNHTN